jgi:hypothetical protein
MKSKRSHEGYLMVDNRAAAVAAGMPHGAGLFEAPTYTCSHCQTVVIINPARNRERAYCRKCDHYLCDTCGAAAAQTGICRTFKQIIDETQERAVRAQQSGSMILTI